MTERMSWHYIEGWAVVPIQHFSFECVFGYSSFVSEPQSLAPQLTWFPQAIELKAINVKMGI